MASMRAAAEDTYKGKLDRMGLSISTSTTGPKGVGQERAMADGTDGEASGSRAKGYATEAENEETLEAKAPKKLRLDRPNFASGGRVKKKAGTTVNVIVAPQGGAGAAPPGPPMMPPKPPMAPPMPPPEMPGGGGPPMGGAPMARARGGRVPMTEGSGSGLGRLAKIKEYGDRAKPGGKAGTL